MARIYSSLPGWGTVKRIGPYLPPATFISLHYLYFIGTCLLTSVIFYCTSTPAWSITYTDSLYLVVSAMTEAGLNTVNLSQMNTFQQWLLWMHILGGSAIFVSIFVIHVRKRSFEKRFGELLKAQEEQRKKRRETFRDASGRSFSMRRSFSFNMSPTKANKTGDNMEKLAAAEPQKSNGTAGGDLRINTAKSKGSSDETERNSGGEMGQGRGFEYPHASEVQGKETTHRESNRKLTNTNDPNNEEAIIDEPVTTVNSDQNGPDHIKFVSGTAYNPTVKMDQTPQIKRRNSAFSFTGVGASPVTTSFRRPGISELTNRQPARPNLTVELNDGSATPWHYGPLLRKEVMGRNSQFHGLTLEEREQLGGVEYRAITLLSWVIPLYFILWQLLGCLGVGAWMAYNASDITEANGINPWWNGAFNAVSAFNNSGMSLLDLNMIPFQQSTYPVFTMGLLILAGNTAYPVFLRLILWVMYCIIPNDSYYAEWKTTLKFVLDHPRRVYTNLFPSAPTWWLLLSLIVLNGTDWIAFELLNLGNAVVSTIPAGPRVLDGLFQALAVRSGGFYIVPIANLRIGTQVLYVLMMYISAYPVVITMRNSNVYEERSLGIYADDPGEQKRSDDPELGAIGRLKRTMTGFKPATETRSYFIRQQMRGQLAHDLSWLAIAVLLIVCIENSSFEADPITFSVFNVVFEVVSGYGCVGITTGLPNQAYSFSGAWHVVSKLILCAVMIRGRHRGLPVAIDRAVLLPGEGLVRKEEEDHEIRRGRTFDLGGEGQDGA